MSFTRLFHQTAHIELQDRGFQKSEMLPLHYWNALTGELPLKPQFDMGALIYFKVIIKRVPNMIAKYIDRCAKIFSEFTD